MTSFSRDDLPVSFRKLNRAGASPNKFFKFSVKVAFVYMRDEASLKVCLFVNMRCKATWTPKSHSKTPWLIASDDELEYFHN